MKTTQIVSLIILWITVESSHAGKTSRKMSAQDNLASASGTSHRIIRSRSKSAADEGAMATAYVLTSTLPEPKIDAHQLIMQENEAAAAQAHAYAAAIAAQHSHAQAAMAAQHTHAQPQPYAASLTAQHLHAQPYGEASHQLHSTMFTPNDAVDISKLYTYKTVKAYVPYEKLQQSLYKSEQPLSYVYTAGEPSTHGTHAATPLTYDAHAATPLAYTQAIYTGKDDVTSHHTDSYASKYKFGYRVSDPHTGADFGHSEVKEGHVTKGHYHVLLPDGRMQNVKYWAGPSGYHATVSYEGTKYHYAH